MRMNKEMKKAVLRTFPILFLVFLLCVPHSMSLSFGGSFHGDSPWDAPRDESGRLGTSSIELSSSSGTEFSPSTDADPWVKFKVNEGWDLDQYLFKESSPIDFYIDVDDFKPDPTISPKPKLTLKVWDVDYVAPVDPPERDRVEINGHALGLLTGANNQWSTPSFEVDPSFIVEGENHIQVFIDLLGDEWAVEVDWAELKIPFNIKVTKIEVVDGTDIEIKKGDTDHIITGPIWEKKFDATGKLIEVPGVSGDTKRDYPIATWFKGNHKFKVKITVDTWPKQWKTSLKWKPKIGVGWLIWEYRPWIMDDFDFHGWEKEFDVTPPPEVGIYLLRFWTFRFSKDDKYIADPQFTDHKLYVTYDESISREIKSGTAGAWPNAQLLKKNIKPPKEKWLEVACKWAMGAKTDEEVVSKTTISINYKPKWRYEGFRGFGHPNKPFVFGFELIEEKNNHGSCGSFKDVLQILSGVLGVNVGEESIPWQTLPFVTKPIIALDGNKGNAYEDGKTWVQRDSWVFNDHEVGKYKNKCYDPTFRVVQGFADINENIYAWGKHRVVRIRESSTGNVVEVQDPTIAIVDPTHRVRGFINPATGNPVIGDILGEYFKAEKGANKATLYPETPQNDEERRWGKWRYKHNPGKLVIQTESILRIAEFTTNFSDYGFDTDGDSLYNFLVTQIDVNITEVGNYFTSGILSYNGTRITLASDYSYLNATIQTIKLFFSGKDIYEARVSGNYSVDLILYNENSTLIDYRVFNTSLYHYTEFEGLFIELTNLTDYGRDIDLNGLYDYLTVELSLNVTRTGNYSISGALFTNESYVASVFNYTFLNSGPQTMYLDFDGIAIRRSRTNGPYTLHLTLSDLIYSKTSTCNTSMYSYIEFEQLSAGFTGAFFDYGTDIDSDGLFDFLSLNVGTKVFVAGNYTIFGYLFDYTGKSITAASNFTYLGTGISNVVLNFNGTMIYSNGISGPYTLRFLQLFDVNESLIDDMDKIYNTTAYSYTIFQRPKAFFTGSYSDYGVDTDIESTYTRTYLPHEWIGGGTPMGWHGDDDSWSYTLPFNFPSYGTNYTTIYISSNGLIAFLGPDASYSNSISALAGKLAIAPAWDDWVTDEPHDIYTWQNSTHVGIRWYVRVYGSSTVANFEVILRDDGVIQFNYEHNNGPISTTIGVSNGAGDILAEDVTNLNNINSIIFTAGDGLFNHLSIQVELSVTKAENYTLEGTLHDANGSLIISTTNKSYFNIGTQLSTLNFDGVSIYSHGVNGSYNLGLRLYDEGDNIVDIRYNVYNTTAYNYTDFQKPIIKLTGTFSDFGNDTDTDGFYNYLAVEIEVIVQHSGTYEVNARLTDIHDNEIIWASDSIYLNKDTPQTIQLDFDGRYIFGNGVNGPYYVKDLSIYYSNIALYISDVYTTSTYNYTQFQKSAIVLGTVTNVKTVPVVNALVYISAVDYKYTNINGSYKLIILQTGTYTIEVVPPPELSLLSNSTTIDVTVGETTILNIILRPLGDFDEDYDVDYDDIIYFVDAYIKYWSGQGKDPLCDFDNDCDIDYDDIITFVDAYIKYWTDP